MIMSPPGPNIGGDVSPLSHRDRRPWKGGKERKGRGGKNEPKSTRLAGKLLRDKNGEESERLVAVPVE